MESRHSDIVATGASIANANANDGDRFATLVAHSPDVMFRLDRELRFVYINPAVTRWTGLAPDVFHGKTGLEAGLRGTVWQPLAAKCREAFAGGEITQVEFSDDTPQGLLHFEARLIPEFDEQRRVASLLGIVTDVTSQRRVQSSLSDSLKSFRQVADHAAEIIWVADAAGAVEYINARFTLTTGLPVREALQEGWVNAVHPDDVARVRTFWRHSVKAGFPYADEFRIVSKSGGYRWQAATARPVRDARGQVLRWVGTLLDIDNLKRATQALRESEERLQLAFSASGHTLWDWNLETGALFVAPEMMSKLGYAKDEIAPSADAWARLLHPDDRARARATVIDALKDHGPYEMEIRLLHKAGHYLNVLTRGTLVRRVSDGRMVRLVGTHLDVTARRRAAGALRTREAQLALAKDAAHLGVFDHDMRSGVMHWDERAAALWGIGAASPMTYEVIQAHMHPDYRQSNTAAIERARDPAGSGRYYLEYRVVTRPGEPVRWVASNGRVLFEAGLPVRQIGMLQDITGRKLAQERALLDKDELLSLAETAGNVGSFEWLVQTDVIHLSPRLRQIYGMDVFDGSRASWLRQIHPADVERLRGALDGIWARRETVYAVEFRLLRPDGSVCWIESHARVSYDGEGRPLRIIGQHADITEHKEAEQSLIEANQSLRRMSMNQTRLTEEERSRIARNLHDGVGQLLYLAGLRLSAAINLASGKSMRGTLEDVFGVIGQATRDIRSIEFELSPPQLRQLGLLPALAWLTEDLRRQFGLQVTVADDAGDKPLDPFIGAILYRAVRELLINVAKHAKVDAARVEVRRAGECIEITVSDQGVGLRGRASATGGGMGLRGLHEALISGGCNIAITSPAEGGTVAVLIAPLLSAADRTALAASGNSA